MKNYLYTMIPTIRFYFLFTFCLIPMIFIRAQHDPEWWEDLGTMPIAKAIAGIAEMEGKIYIAGGAGDPNATGFASMEVYDPETKSWNTLANMNYVRTGMTLSAVNGKLYAIGGGLEAISTTIVGVVEEYDPETNLWTPKSSMPEPRMHHTAVVYADKIYIIGGNEYDGADSYEWCAGGFMYDPANDQWDTIAPMKTERNMLTSVVCNNRIYVFGGYSLTTFNVGTNKVESYDPLTDSWSDEDTTFLTVVGGTAVNFRDTIYLVGGNGGDGTIYAQEFYRYAPWNMYESIPLASVWGQHILVGDYLYYFGGFILPSEDSDFLEDFIATNQMARIDMLNLPSGSTGTKLTEYSMGDRITIYPNPVRDRSTISYTLSAESDVEITIRNSLGVELEQLIKERQTPGKHEIEWHPPVYLPAGVYLCHFILGNHQQYVTMIIKTASH